MKRSFIPIVSLIISATLLFTGCASYPDLTEEENELVSEYAVSLLLKYDSENHSRLVDTSEFLNKYNTALTNREEAKRAYEAARQLEEETRRQEAEAQEQANAGSASSSSSSSSGSQSGNDGTGGATVIDSSEPTVSLEQFLNCNDFSIKYAGYMLTDSYPQGSTDYFFAMDATQGNTLMVVSFNVTNNGSAQQLNIYAEAASFKLNVNNQGYKTVFPAMLEDEMSNFLGDFSSGETKKLILIYEVPDDTSVSSLSMMVSTKAKGAITLGLE